jgi:hypothetical protein
MRGTRNILIQEVKEKFADVETVYWREFPDKRESVFEKKKPAIHGPFGKNRI